MIIHIGATQRCSKCRIATLRNSTQRYRYLIIRFFQRLAAMLGSAPQRGATPRFATQLNSTQRFCSFTFSPFPAQHIATLRITSLRTAPLFAALHCNALLLVT